MKHPSHALISLCLLASALLSACSSTPLTSAEVAGDKPAPQARASESTPLPPGAVLLSGESLILGAGEQWVGRMVLDVGRDADIAYKFFYETYPLRGWNLITAVRGEVSLLVFTQGDRSLSIEVRQGHFLGGGRAIVTASPNRSAGQSAPAMGTPLPARR